jgi:hypothetical protein
MIEVGILKNFDSGTYKAGVQLMGSLTTYFDDISVARNIPSSALVIGNYVILAMPGGNPGDACVIAAWPQGSAGGGAGSFLDLSDTPSSYEGQAGKLPRVNSDENALEFIGPTLLADLVRAANFQMIPTAAGWTEDINGSGVAGQQPFRNLVYVWGAPAGSYARLYTQAYGYNEGGTYQFINWDKELFFIFNYSRYNSQAAVKAWVQVAETGISHADLSSEGIGIVIKNMDLYGESYGTSRAEHSLNTTLANQEQCQIVIHHSPGNFVKWYVNGTLQATESTAGKFPAGVGTVAIWMNHAIYDGGIATTGLTVSNMMQGKIWQAR